VKQWNNLPREKSLPYIYYEYK